MASKYAKVFPRLKKLPIQDLSYQQQIDVVKSEILEAKESEPDDVIHASVEVILEEIADATKALCQVLVNAPRGRRHAVVFARYWLELYKAEDFIEQQLKNVRLLLKAMEQLGVEQFEVEGTDRIKFDELGAVSARPEVIIRVNDKDVFRNWCVEHDLFRELNMHISTAQALTRTLLLNGDPEPDGITAYVNTKFTK